MKNIVKFCLFLLVSVLLFWLVYRDQNWEDLLKVLKEDVNYTWVWVACVMGIVSHVARALRWQMLAETMGYRIRFWNSFMGVMIGYFANLAIPRMGEFTRCAVVGKYEKTPFSNLLGTVVAERVVDVVILLALTVLVVVLVGLVLLWKLYLRKRLGERIRSFVHGLKEGLLAVKDMRGKWLFVGYSLFIWLMYFLMFYVCFFCFEFTSGLNMLVGLTCFVLSSYGMVAPVQGGIGAWHFMVIAALMIYLPHTPNIESMAKVFALLTHGAMTLLYIVVGVICVIAMPLYNHSFSIKRK